MQEVVMTFKEPASKKFQTKSQSGFTLIEILMALVLIGILTYVSLQVISGSVSDARFDETVQEMHVIADAIVGNKNLQEGGSRTSFGYFGDVGALPSAIGDLTTKPGTVSAYTVSTTNRTGYGWNGPYLQTGDNNADYTTDAWGTAYVYDSAAGTLKSYGADKVAGGTSFNQDILLSFPTSERLATVSGFVSSAGGPPAIACKVQLNYPDGNGGLTQSLQDMGANGSFSFTNVPYGVRSIAVGCPDMATIKIGPVVITVDKPKVFVPATQLDLNP